MFLSTFLTVAGHYTVRGFIFVQESILRLHNRSSDFIIEKQRDVERLRTKRKKQRRNVDSINYGGSEPTEAYYSESDDDDDDDGNELINSLTYEAP